MRELTLPGRMILLPGFGYDGRVFEAQRRAFGGRLETPDWITHEPGESLRQYAHRWARQLSRPDDDTPLVIGGHSMGGVIAQEMMHVIQPTPRCVLLIASTRRPDRWSLGVQAGLALGKLMPAEMGRSFASMAILPVALRDGLDDAGKRLLRAMVKDADPGLMKWQASAMMDWPGPPEPLPGDPPVYHLHGEKDWVIHAAPDADEVIEGGRHNLPLSHAGSVNRFLFDHMLQHVPASQGDDPRVEDPHTTAQRRLMLEGAPAGTPLD